MQNKCWIGAVVVCMELKLRDEREDDSWFVRLGGVAQRIVMERIFTAQTCKNIGGALRWLPVAARRKGKSKSCEMKRHSFC